MTTKVQATESLADHLSSYEGREVFSFASAEDRAGLAEFVIDHLDELEVLTLTDVADVIDAGEPAAAE
ncbi:hypothetical protein pEaSNUABM54_00093 [Erwinia phage pEa_SNUABM_54]|nr:hypothetical protein pEaSNUABM54_00093 [Erwinia phage pEa_SNUABM_54]